jgi:hypothetical protein
VENDAVMARFEAVLGQAERQGRGEYHAGAPLFGGVLWVDSVEIAGQEKGVAEKSSRKLPPSIN